MIFNTEISKAQIIKAYRRAAASGKYFVNESNYVHCSSCFFHFINDQVDLDTGLPCTYCRRYFNYHFNTNFESLTECTGLEAKEVRRMVSKILRVINI